VTTPVAADRLRPAVPDGPHRQLADLGAEQAVLGAVMMAPLVADEVSELITTADFYDQRHAAIYAVATALLAQDRPADALTVAHALAEAGDLDRCGGAGYLHTLLASVPTAANAGFYARIVANYAVRRRLRNTAIQLDQFSTDLTRDIADVVEGAQRAVHDATVPHASVAVPSYGDLLGATLSDVLDDSRPRGLSTGIGALDDVLGGLKGGQLIVVAGRPGLGKALALETPMPTPSGWTTMGDVRIGDQLIGADGRPTTVVAATRVTHGRPCYEITFSDGAVIVADAEHQWLTETRRSRRAAQEARVARHGFATIKTTEEIASSVRCKTADGRANHSVVVADPFDLPDAELPIDPYVLGAWLGDGDSWSGGFTSADPEIITQIELAGYVVTRGARYRHYIRKLRAQLRDIGLLRNKHIPDVYQRGSENQRRALLAGLLDTDGTVTSTGNAQFCTTSKRLAEGTRELIHTLGYRTRISTKRVNGRTEESSICYMVNFTTPDKVFRLHRKAVLQVTETRPTTRLRYIVNVRQIESVPVRCVQVDNVDSMYLAGRSCIPTHNSVIVVGLARAAAMRRNIPSLMFSLEMSSHEVMCRILSAETGIELTRILRGGLTAAERMWLQSKAEAIRSAPFYVDATKQTDLGSIRSITRHTQQRHGLGLLVVDYLQLMTSPQRGRTENRTQEVGDISRGLKLLAGQCNIPVVAAAQLNRMPEQRTDRRPQLSDLRDSGSIEQDADVVILLHRPDYYDPEHERAGEIDFIIAKHRNGPTETVTAAAQLSKSRIVDFGIQDQ
jgi:replicative DNA helicase